MFEYQETRRFFGQIADGLDEPASAELRALGVEKIDPAKSYAFQDNLMLGHEMSLALRPGETFTRYFSSDASGWSEPAAHCKSIQPGQKGYCELIYAPTADNAKAAPNKNGAAGPKPCQPPIPCHNRPAIRLAGRAARPMAAL